MNSKSAKRGAAGLAILVSMAAAILGIVGRNPQPGVDLMPAVTVATSPNQSSRNGARVQFIVLHATAGASCAQDLAWMRLPRAQVSAHYLVCEDGKIYRLVDESRMAWHAGHSAWEGHRNLNGITIGIEFANRNNGTDAYDPPQLLAGAQLVRSIKMRYGLPDRNVLTHQLIAPDRKNDPRAFPWERFKPSTDLGNYKEFPGLPYKVYQPFRNEWERTQGLLGNPVTHEFMERQPDGTYARVQYFELGRLEFHQDFSIRFGATGIEAYNARYSR